VGSVVVRTRAYVCALIPQDDVLVLNTLRYAEEVLPATVIDAPPGSVRKAGVSAKEFDLALKLVEDMSAPWDAKQFKDTYREDLLKRVEEKARKGQSHTLTRPGREKPARRSAEIVDLTALLRRSLEEKSQRPAGGTARRRAARPARRTRRRA
jgi:DNA end-binding protein Ku